MAQEREYLPSRAYIQRVTKIQDSMSRECRYDKSLSDIKCDGCPRRGSGEAYAKKVMEIGK